MPRGVLIHCPVSTHRIHRRAYAFARPMSIATVRFRALCGSKDPPSLRYLHISAYMHRHPMSQIEDTSLPITFSFEIAPVATHVDTSSGCVSPIFTARSIRGFQNWLWYWVHAHVCVMLSVSSHRRHVSSRRRYSVRCNTFIPVARSLGGRKSRLAPPDLFKGQLVVKLLCPFRLARRRLKLTHGAFLSQ